MFGEVWSFRIYEQDVPVRGMPITSIFIGRVRTPVSRSINREPVGKDMLN
jgi:hypothetical protein